jgi:hypothetical protein
MMTHPGGTSSKCLYVRLYRYQQVQSFFRRPVPPYDNFFSSGKHNHVFSSEIRGLFESSSSNVESAVDKCKKVQ